MGRIWMDLLPLGISLNWREGGKKKCFKIRFSPSNVPEYSFGGQRKLENCLYISTCRGNVGRFAVETIPPEDCGKTIGRILCRVCRAGDFIGATSRPLIFPFRLKKIGMGQVSSAHSPWSIVEAPFMNIPSVDDRWIGRNRLNFSIRRILERRWIVFRARWKIVFLSRKFFNYLLSFEFIQTRYHRSIKIISSNPRSLI